MSLDIKKIYTDSPYVDEVVYYAKQLAVGTVLKLEDQALKHETISSLNNARTYIGCIEDTIKLSDFTLSDQLMNDVIDRFIPGTYRKGYVYKDLNEDGEEVEIFIPEEEWVYETSDNRDDLHNGEILVSSIDAYRYINLSINRENKKILKIDNIRGSNFLQYKEILAKVPLANYRYEERDYIRYSIPINQTSNGIYRIYLTLHKNRHNGILAYDFLYEDGRILTTSNLYMHLYDINNGSLIDNEYYSYIENLNFDYMYIAIDSDNNLRLFFENDTIYAIPNPDQYIYCEDMEISTNFLLGSKYVPYEHIDDYADVKERMYAKNYIDFNQKELREYLKSNFIENYEEQNMYYRMLYGLPPLEVLVDGNDGDYVEDWIPPVEVAGTIDLDKPIHLMNEAEVEILERYNVLESIIAEDPVNREYMYHLGNKRIDYYLARKANRFDVLYIPEIESEAISYMYREKIDENKFYTLRTVYSEAFKYNSDYYDNFIAVFIVLITMIDLISRTQEFIVRKEIFDIRSVEYIFKSYGVPFYPEIPLKYQISMVKNLHKLLKYKSTSKCMVDICSLFGFNNISAFKYYLLKDRKIDPDTGRYVVSTAEDEATRLNEEYSLKFLKLPLDDNVDDYIRSRKNYLDYDEITRTDPRWDGELDHDHIIAEILKQEFNYTRTKYISIDSMYDLAEMANQQCYFFNFLYDNANIDVESELKIKIPYISTTSDFLISDVFTLLTALTYQYNGIKDTIMDTQTKVLYVNGFNFKADLAALAQDIYNRINLYSGTTRTRAEKAIQILNEFNIPTETIPSFKEMMQIFTNNMKVKDALLEGMQEAETKVIYDIYKHLYDSLMTIELTMDYYAIDPEAEVKEFYKDEDGDATYSEYLKHKAPLLYDVMLQISTFDDNASKNQYIATVIDSVLYALEEYIKTDEFQYLFSNLPIMSSEAVKNYMVNIIDFFKSYKIDFLGINSIYTLDDKTNNIIKLIDDPSIITVLNSEEYFKFQSNFRSFQVNKTSSDNLGLKDRVYIEAIPIFLYLNDIDILTDDCKLSGILDVDEYFVKAYSDVIMNVNTTISEDLGFEEKIWILLSKPE